MRADGLLATLDRWGRLLLPGTLLLLFVLLTLAPLHAPYLSDVLPLLPTLVVFQFSLATPERLPGPVRAGGGLPARSAAGGRGRAGGRGCGGFRVDWARGGPQPPLPGRRALPVSVDRLLHPHPGLCPHRLDVHRGLDLDQHRSWP